MQGKETKYAALCTQTKCIDRRIITFIRLGVSIRSDCIMWTDSKYIYICECVFAKTAIDLKFSCGPVYCFCFEFHHKNHGKQTKGNEGDDENHRYTLAFAHYAFFFGHYHYVIIMEKDQFMLWLHSKEKCTPFSSAPIDNNMHVIDDGGFALPQKEN